MTAAYTSAATGLGSTNANSILAHVALAKGSAMHNADQRVALWVAATGRIVHAMVAEGFFGASGRMWAAVCYLGILVDLGARFPFQSRGAVRPRHPRAGRAVPPLRPGPVLPVPRSPPARPQPPLPSRPRLPTRRHLYRPPSWTLAPLSTRAQASGGRWTWTTSATRRPLPPRPIGTRSASLATKGFSRVAQQRGLYRSPKAETLAPPEHLGQALQISLDEPAGSVSVPAFTMEGVER